MARVALCWELGAGVGHLTALGAFAKTLIERGHEVQLISKNLASAALVPSTRQLTTHQAPEARNRLQLESGACNYAELLLSCGYHDSLQLSALVKSWRQLLTRIGANLVIADHSPTALIAARSIGVDCILTGSGFYWPPQQSPMPTIQPWTGANQQRHDQQRMVDSEDKVLGNINIALESSHTPSIGSIGTLYPAAKLALTSYLELDHYGDRDLCYVGVPDNTDFSTIPIWPNGCGDKIFIYTYGHYRHFKFLLQGLARVENPVLVVAQGISPGQNIDPGRRNIKIQTERVNLDEVAEQARLVVNHGGHGIVLGFLKKGIPSLMLPHHTEGAMLAWRLAQQNLSLAATPNPDNYDMKVMLQTLATHQGVWDNAAKFAEKYRDGRHVTPIGTVLTAFGIA